MEMEEIINVRDWKLKRMEREMKFDCISFVAAAARATTAVDF